MSSIFAFKLLCSLSIQLSERIHKGANEENGLSSDDYTPSPSDEEYEHTLDCSSKSHIPRGQDHILESKEETQEPHELKAPTDPKIEVVAPTDEKTVEPPPTVPYPVPKPRLSRQTTPNSEPSPPVARPRTVHIFTPTTPEHQTSPTPASEIPKAVLDSHPKQSLRKLQLTAEEKSQLVNLHSFSADSDSETPGGSSSCSSSSATAGGPSHPKPEGQDGQEEDGYWSGSTASNYREKRHHRRGIRKKELLSRQTRVRSKFSPWNLSSPRISRDTRLSVLINHPGRVGKLKTHLCCDHLVKKYVCRQWRPLFWGVLGPFRFIVIMLHFSTETTFSHAHSPSEEGVDGDDDDDDDDDEMFERDIDLYDEKVRRGMELTFLFYLILSCYILQYTHNNGTLPLVSDSAIRPCRS